MRLPFPIGSDPSLAVESAGAALGSLPLTSGAGLSLPSKLGSSVSRAPGIEILNQGCATVAAVRIVNGGIAVLRVASAGPAKGSVFKEICRSFRRALHTRNRKGWRLSLVQQVVGELRNV